MVMPDIVDMLKDIIDEFGFFKSLGWLIAFISFLLSIIGMNIYSWNMTNAEKITDPVCLGYSGVMLVLGIIFFVYLHHKEK